MTKSITELRSHPRIKERLPIRWQVQNSNINGEGRILNISASGMLIETRAGMSPLQNCLFTFTSFLKGENNFIPQNGRLAWSRPARLGKDRYHWGVEFVNPAQETASKLKEHLHSRVARWARIQGAQNIVGYFFFAVAVAMTAFILTQHNLNYRNLSLSTIMAQSAATTQAELYRGTREALITVQSELADTRQILGEAESFIGQIQQENLALKQEMESLRLDIDFGNQIVFLKEQNAQLEAEVVALQNRLQAFEGNVPSLEEGRAMLAFYKDKTRQIKKKMRILKQEARRERDRLFMIQGNQGVLAKGYYIPAVQEQRAVSPDESNVNIDVSFFE